MSGIGSRAARALLVGFIAAPATLGATVVIGPSRDGTLYQSATGSLANGSGPGFFAGRTDVITGGAIRRGVIAFDVAASVPAGSTITSVSLRLNVSRSNSGLQPISLHRLLASWGEGTSVAPGEGGGGGPSAPNDATWIHRFFDTVLWTRPGGDFDATPSATIQVGLIGQYTWLSTPALVADVQSWLNNPGANFGWIVIGNESTLNTAKRFDSSENLTPGVRPMLVVDYAAVGTPAGRVPDGDAVPGPPLVLSHAGGGGIQLSWGASCLAGDTDYEVYAGTMNDFTTYGPIACSTGGATTLTVTPSATSQFFLVVPRNNLSEGSYGTRSGGLQRPPGAGACLQQSIGACP